MPTKLNEMIMNWQAGQVNNPAVYGKAHYQL